MTQSTTHTPSVDDRDWTKLTFGEQVKNSSVKAPFKIKLYQGYIDSQLYDI